MTLLIDNYDSFSYNLYQIVGTLDPDILVIRNDEKTVDEIEALHPDRTARTADGEIMGVQHKSFPIYGLQFHPESIITPDGTTMIKNFIKEVQP